MMKNNLDNDFMNLLAKFFTEFLPITVNASPNTIQSYKCTFRLLFRYISEKSKNSRISFETLDFELLTDFFEWLLNVRKNSRSTAKQRMGALSSFADFAQNYSLEAGYIFRNSLSKISKASLRRVKNAPRCSFTREELKILFSLPDTTDTIGWRDLVLLTVMYASGARAQEICNLTVGDIAHDSNGNAVLTLVGKGNKSRRVRITTESSALLYKYISFRKISDCRNRHVFSSQRNEQISISCIEEIYAKYIATAKTNFPNLFCSGRYTPHVMRHTTATHLIEAGVPLVIVKNILGHSSIQSTQIYLDISQQAVDKAMQAWNEKWFSSDKLINEGLPKSNDTIPEFLR